MEIQGKNKGLDGVTVEASDGKGGNISFLFWVDVKDTTPPTFTNNPAVSQLQADQFDLSATINEKGTLYFVVLPAQAATPTVSQVVNGKDGNDKAGIANGNVLLEKEIEGRKTITGLISETSYDVYVVSKDQSNNLQNQVTKLSITTLSTPKLLSKLITNFDFQTEYATQARGISKAMTTSNFASDPKEFTISDRRITIPVRLDWDIPTNNGQTDFSIAQVIGSAIESHIQQYCNDHGIPLGERTLTAGGFFNDNTFFLSSFQTGSNVEITVGGRDWNYFFDQNFFTGSNPDYTKNRTFTVSDGVNTTTIQLTWEFDDMDDLVKELNRQLSKANVGITVVKANENQFELKANNPQGKVQVDGTNKGEFFLNFVSE